MTRYVLVPVICLSVYAFLLVSMSLSKKDRLIKSYICVLIAMILWTGGSFLMRIGMIPSIKFWYDISILGLLSCVFTLFSFVIVYINKKIDLNCIVWFVIMMILAIINAYNGWFIPAPELVETASGVKFIYTTTYHAYILYAFSIVGALNLCYRVIKSINDNKELINELRPLFIGILSMLLGHLLYFLPVFKGFPIDIISGIVMAICMYYMVYQRKLFKLTLLVSKMNIQIFSFLCTILIFVYSIEPLDAFISLVLGKYSKYSAFMFALLFTVVTYAIFKFFSSFIDKVFIKNEIRQNEALREYSLEVNKSLKIEDVIELTINNLKSVLDTNDIIIALLDEKKGEYVLYGDKKYFAYPNINANSQVFKYLDNVNVCVSYAEFTRSIYYRSLWQKDKEYLINLNIDLMVPLKEEKLIGAILLSKKTKGSYKYDEIVYLTSLASVATIAIKNGRLYNKVFIEATHDDLTGLYNRRFFYEVLEESFEKMKSSLTMMNISIDDFRLYNQLYGNSIGDDALKKIAEIIKATVGKKGFAARSQGKEYLVLLPEYTVSQAINLGEEIRKQIQQINSSGTINAKVLTASIGIANIPLNASNIKQLIECTDHATFVAKKSGKNCINVYNIDTIQSNDRKQALKASKIYSEYSNTIYALQAAIDTKDHYTFSHSNNVGYYATELAKDYGLSENIVEIIREAALLHDIGKIGIPEHILNKAGRLTSDEYEIIKTHVDNSIGIIRHLPSLDYVIPAVVSHHERWDGKGYPRKISGNDIPFSGRILCIADCFDAMTSKRAYKEAYSVDKALDEIDKQANRQFDPELAALFIKLVKEGKIELRFK